MIYKSWNTLCMGEEKPFFVTSGQNSTGNVIWSFMWVALKSYIENQTDVVWEQKKPFFVTSGRNSTGNVIWFIMWVVLQFYIECLYVSRKKPNFDRTWTKQYRKCNMILYVINPISPGPEFPPSRVGRIHMLCTHMY